jgi:hypothetical protein
MLKEAVKGKNIYSMIKMLIKLEKKAQKKAQGLTNEKN